MFNLQIEAFILYIDYLRKIIIVEPIYNETLFFFKNSNLKKKSLIEYWLHNIEDFKKKNTKKTFYILFVSTTIDLFINMHQYNCKNNIANEHTSWNRKLK